MAVPTRTLSLPTAIWKEFTDLAQFCLRRNSFKATVSSLPLSQNRLSFPSTTERRLAAISSFRTLPSWSQPISGNWESQSVSHQLRLNVSTTWRNLPGIQGWVRSPRRICFSPAPSCQRIWGEGTPRWCVWRRLSVPLCLIMGVKNQRGKFSTYVHTTNSKSTHEYFLSL